MNSVYFNVHDILSEDQRIKIKILCPFSWSGLTTGADDGLDSAVERNATIELPIYQAIPMLKTPFASATVPRAFNLKMRADLNANAANVPLKDFSSYYYSLGCKLMELFASERLSDLLYMAFMARLSLLTRPLECTNDIASVAPLEVNSIESLGFCPISKMDLVEYHSMQIMIHVHVYKAFSFSAIGGGQEAI